ncbi:MAG: hypothetical protein SFX19_10010 [Alphaproteobacteria bacterium]|nr:hypothetical protein [Alphaproteobacteria bacterium]
MTRIHMTLELSTHIQIIRDTLKGQRNSISMALSRYPHIQKRKLEQVDMALACLEAIESGNFVQQHPVRDIAKEKPHLFGKAQEVANG